MGYVYLLVSGNDIGDETFKIGVTKRLVKNRIKELKTGSSNEIDLIYSYESENYLKIEKYFHRKYKYNKTVSNNEWFNLTNDEVLNFISDCENFDNDINFLKEQGNPFIK